MHAALLMQSPPSFGLHIWVRPGPPCDLGVPCAYRLLAPTTRMGGGAISTAAGEREKNGEYEEGPSILCACTINWFHFVIMLMRV